VFDHRVSSKALRSSYPCCIVVGRDVERRLKTSSINLLGPMYSMLRRNELLRTSGSNTCRCVRECQRLLTASSTRAMRPVATTRSAISEPLMTSPSLIHMGHGGIQPPLSFSSLACSLVKGTGTICASGVRLSALNR